MARILTVDDSRAIRSIVTRQVMALGFEVEEAEDGEQGLQRLAVHSFDLVLLDVTMPVLDGPAMLAKMRERGIKTPVLMLTSESKRSIVASVMAQGIEDYILKPFQPEELRTKILKALRMVAPPMTPPAPAPAPAHAPTVDGPPPAAGNSALLAPPAAATTVDVLVVDDVENVAKKLRSMVPERLSMESCLTAQAALTVARRRTYRSILIDVDIPEVNSAVLASQLRKLQPNATFLALYLRTTNDAENEARSRGFDGVLLKPFDPVGIEALMMKWLGQVSLLVTTEDNVVRIERFSGWDTALDRYLSRLTVPMEKCLSDVAAGCFDEVVLDLTHFPPRADRVPKFILATADKAKKIGMELRLVGTTEMQKILESFTDTKMVPFFETVAAAKGRG